MGKPKVNKEALKGFKLLIDTDNYLLTTDGLCLKKGDTTLVPVSAPFVIESTFSGFESEGKASGDAGIVISYQCVMGCKSKHQERILMSDMSNIAKLEDKLAANHFHVNEGMIKNLVGFLKLVMSPNHTKEFGKIPKAKVVFNTGFNPSLDTFSLPYTSVSSKADLNHVIFNGDDDGTFATSGTLKEWQDNVAILAKGNSRLTLALSIAFTSPLLAPLGINGGGFHLYGRTSKGKTTSGYLAGSVWGGPVFQKPWSSTALALQLVAASRSHTLLFLDDMSHIAPKQWPEMITVAYSLADGTGKGSAQKDYSLREQKQWKVIYLSNGENSFTDLAKKHKVPVPDGAAVRLVDIPIFPSGCEVGFENLQEFKDGYTFAKNIERVKQKYYGTASLAYLAELVKLTKDDYLDLQEDINDWKISHTPQGSDSQVERVIERFALVAVAGKLAVKFGVIPLTNEDIDWAIDQCLIDWVAARGTIGASEQSKAKHYIYDFIMTHGNSRFEYIEGNNSERDKTLNRAGWRDISGAEDYYHFTTAAFEEACKELNHIMVAKELYELGVLLKSKSYTKKIDRLANKGAKVFSVNMDRLQESLGGDK